MHIWHYLTILHKQRGKHMQCVVIFSRQCIAGTRTEHVHSHFEVLRLSTPASGKPYRHTCHVCKDEGSKAAAKSDAYLSRRICVTCISTTSSQCFCYHVNLCWDQRGIDSLRCRRQIVLASRLMVSIMLYLVLVLLINTFCHLFLPWGICIHLHSMQNLNFVIAQHALTVNGKLYLKGISSWSICPD